MGVRWDARPSGSDHVQTTRSISDWVWLAFLNFPFYIHWDGVTDFMAGVCFASLYCVMDVWFCSDCDLEAIVKCLQIHWQRHIVVL